MVDLDVEVDVGGHEGNDGAGHERGEERRALRLRLRVCRRTHFVELLLASNSIDGPEGRFGFA
jgi:hypothetical protein